MARTLPSPTQLTVLRAAAERDDARVITTDRTLQVMVRNGWADRPRYAYGRGQARATLTDYGRDLATRDATP